MASRAAMRHGVVSGLGLERLSPDPGTGSWELVAWHGSGRECCGGAIEILAVDHAFYQKPALLAGSAVPQLARRQRTVNHAMVALPEAKPRRPAGEWLDVEVGRLRLSCQLVLEYSQDSGPIATTDPPEIPLRAP